MTTAAFKATHDFGNADGLDGSTIGVKHTTAQMRQFLIGPMAALPYLSATFLARLEASDSSGEVTIRLKGQTAGTLVQKVVPLTANADIGIPLDLLALNSGEGAFVEIEVTTAGSKNFDVAAALSYETPVIVGC